MADPKTNNDPRDWSWWDRLDAELAEAEGPFSFFAAWMKVMDAHVAKMQDGEWWGCMDITDKVELFAIMRDLREWCESNPSNKEPTK